jgi:hypothetical protein
VTRRWLLHSKFRAASDRVAIHCNGTLGNISVNKFTSRRYMLISPYRHTGITPCPLMQHMTMELNVKTGFNENFYTVAATTIPVFYLALAVQFSLISRITSQIYKSIEKLQDNSGIRTYIKAAGMVIGFAGPAVIGASIILAGTRGEIVSVMAIYRQSDSGSDRQYVLLAIFILLGANILIPTWIVAVPLYRYAVSAFPILESRKLREWWYRVPNEEPPHSQEGEAAPENADNQDGQSS